MCLLQALNVANLKIDALVYVKRMQHGLWADEHECDVVEDVDVFLKAEGELAEMFSVNDTAQARPALPKLSEELVLYHASYRPFEQATFWYCRTAS